MTIDEQVVEELPWLRRLARRLAADDPDDLVQDTWMLARRDQPEARGAGRLRPWLAQAMRNRLHSVRRAMISRQRREGMSPISDDARSAPEERLLEADVIRVLDEALETLSAEDRALLRDRFFSDRTASDIADELGIPAATVRTRLRRTLARLRGLLDERHGNDRTRWAPAVAAVPLTQTALGGITMASAAKGLVVAGALTGLATLGWVFVDELDSEEAPSAGTAVDDDVASPSSQASKQAPGAASEASISDAATRAQGRDRWTQKLAEIRRAGDARAAANESQGSDEPGEVAELPPPPDMLEQLAELACLDLLPDHPRGRLALQLHYVGEPDIGTVVESVEVVEDTMNAPELRECWSESMYMLDLAPPERPVRGIHKLEYNAGDGKEVDQLLPLLKQFIKAHPELAAKHPPLARCSDLPDDTPMNQWMTPEFMALMGRNPDLNQQLNAFFGQHLKGEHLEAGR